MKISSPAFATHDMMPQMYTCEGVDINPPLVIADAPAATKSFCLIVHDHDALSGDFVHWLVWNIDPRAHEIQEGQQPLGSHEGTNDFGRVGWHGPCPPTGIHRYEFHLYALDTLLDLPPTSNKTDLRDRMKDSIIEEASLIGIYRKG